MVMRSDKVAQPPLAGDRSTTKAKFRAQGVDGDNPSPLSFRDMLMDTQGHSDNVSLGRQDEWELDEEDVTFREEEPVPYIAFSSRIRDRLVEPWEHSVVVKTLGRNLGYRALSFRLNKVWSSTTGFDIIDLANDYFLICFNNAKDVEFALTEGPWTVMGQYLSVQKCTPDFDVVNNKIDRIVAWIRLSEMNIHFYHKNIIRWLGQIIGPVVKIDSNTITAQRGKFSRLAVELDLQKPLVSQFNLEGRIQKVEYKNLPTICFGCGKFGHYREACPDSVDITHTAKEDQLSLTETDKHDIVVTKDLDCQKPKFGEWMVVTRQPRPRKVTDKDTPKAIDKNRNRSGISQSRFGALAELTNEDMHPQDYDDDSVSHREPMISIPENIQTLGPKSRSMKKKPTNLPIRKLSTRKATNPIHLSQPTTENLDPNIQILSNYSYPNSQPPTMHGMHAKHDLFPTPVPCTKSSAPSTSMHGMHDPKQPISNTPAPDPVPVPTTLNPLHHKAVSFPKVALAPKAIAQYPSQRVCDPSLANEPPDKCTPCDFNRWETTAEPEESPVTSRSKSSLAANVCSVDAENGMEVEVEAFESSQ